MEIRKLYINGEWVDSVHDEWIEIENPATHEIIAKVPRGNKEDVDKAVKAARAAFETWQYTPLEERVALMKKVVEGLESRRQELIETITKELGSPYKVSAEVHTDPFILEAKHYIQTASEFPYEQRRLTSVVRREPVGVVGGLTPWNFPLEQIEKKVVPALLAGNCVVLKPSQFTPLTAYILAEEIDKAGYPAGVFNLVTGRGGEVGNALATHEDVDMISLPDLQEQVGKWPEWRLEILRRSLWNWVENQQQSFWTVETGRTVFMAFWKPLCRMRDRHAMH